jgi:hypothetical protein
MHKSACYFHHRLSALVGAPTPLILDYMARLNRNFGDNWSGSSR